MLLLGINGLFLVVLPLISTRQHLLGPRVTNKLGKGSTV